MQHRNSLPKRDPVSIGDFSSARKDKNIRQAAGSVVDYLNQAEALLNFKNLNYESVTSSPGSYQIVKPIGSNVPETPNWNPVSQSNLMSATGLSINQQHVENGGLAPNQQRAESDSSFRIQVRKPQTMRNNQMPRAKPQRKLKLVKTQRSINVVNTGALANAQGANAARNQREESKQEIKPQYVGVCRNGMLKLGAFNTQSSANQMTEAETFTLRPMESTGNLQAQFSSRTHMFSSQRTEEDLLVSKLLTHEASDFSAGVVSDRHKIESRYTSAQALQNLTPRIPHQQILSADDQMMQSSGRNNFSTIRAIQEVANQVPASDQSAPLSIKKQQDASENQQARVAKAYQALNTLILEPEMAYENMMEEEKFTTLKKGSLDASSKQVTDNFMIKEEASSRFEKSSAKTKQQLFSHIHRPSQSSSHRQLHQTQINPFTNNILEEGELKSQIRHSIADQIPQIKDQFGNTKLLSSKDKLMVPMRASNYQSQFFSPNGRNLIQLNTQSHSTKNYHRNLNSDARAKESSHQNQQQYPQHSNQNVQQALHKLSSNHKPSNHVETNSSPRNAFFQNNRILDSEKTSCVFAGFQQSEDMQQLKSQRDVWSPNERCDGTSLAETNFKNESVDRKQFSQHTNGSMINVMPEHVDMSSANQQSIQDSCFSEKAVTVTIKQHLNYRSIDGVVNQMENNMHGQGANLHRKQSQPEFTIKRPSLNQQRTLKKPRIQTANKSQITNHQQVGPKAQLLHRMNQPQEQKGAARKVKFGSQANGNPVSIIQLMRNQKSKRRSVEDLRQESQAQHKMEVTQVRAIYEQIGATELVSPQSRRRSQGSIRRNEQDYDNLMEGSKVQLHVMDFGQDQDSKLEYRDSKRGASPELLDFPSAIKHKGGLGSLATTQQASLVNAAALIEENIYHPPQRVSKINLQTRNAVVDHIHHDPNLQSNLRNMSVGSITQVYERHRDQEEIELSEEPSIGQIQQKMEKGESSPAKIDFSQNNNHLAGQNPKHVNSTSPKQRNVKAYKHQQFLNLALQKSAMHNNSSSRPTLKAYMHSRNNNKASEDFSQIQQQFFMSLDQTKQSGSALHGVVKGEQSAVTDKHMYTTQNFSAANINQSFLPFTSGARQELPLELEIDFTKQMNEVQRERNTKIAKQFKKQTARIKKYSKHMNDHNLASSKAQQKKGNSSCKMLKEGTLLMNKQVYDQMQTMPQTGRLTRLQLNPFAENSFQIVPETASNKARGNTTKLSVRTEVQKSVYIDNSKLEKTTEKANLQNGENVAKKQVNIVVDKSIDRSEDIIVDTSNDEQQSLNNTTKDNLIAQKAAQPVMTINENFFKMMDKELEMHFQKLPKVQALQLESLDPEIAEYLKRRQYSCQNYTIVGKTQEGTTNNQPDSSSYANRLRQDQLQAKIKEVTDKFSKDRELVQQNLNQKWQQVQNEYCIDFTQKRLDQQKDQRVQKNWSFIRSLIEAVKIVSDDRFPLDKTVILDRPIFPSQSYQSGQVKKFLKEVKSGNVRQVAAMIKIDPLIVFQFDEMQQSGLIWAVKRNDEDMTRHLLQKFSRVNFQDLTGRSALSFAVSQSNMAIIKLLLCFKADPESKNNAGQTIYEIYEKAMNKHTNLQIGQYMKLCQEQLKKLRYIQDGWKFVERVRHDLQNNTSWTKQMIRDREWKNQVLVILDPNNTIEQDDLNCHKEFK